MGKIFTGVNGGFSGKVGSVIGSSWREVNYMRGLSKPSSKEPSESQRAQRKRFQIVVKFLSQIKDLLNESYGKLDTSRATGYNLAVQHALKNAVSGGYPDLAIDYPKVQMSQGSLYTTPRLRVASETVIGTVNVTWTSLTNKYNAYSNDIVTVVLYNPSKNLFVVDQSATRENGKVDIDCSQDFSGDTVHCYVFFMTQENGRLSPSVYSGPITVF